MKKIMWLVVWLETHWLRLYRRIDQNRKKRGEKRTKIKRTWFFLPLYVWPRISNRRLSTKCAIPTIEDIASVGSSVGILAAIVAFHEAGHFTAARTLGIHVSKFSIGFGPKLISWNGINLVLLLLFWFIPFSPLVSSIAFESNWRVYIWIRRKERLNITANNGKAVHIVRLIPIFLSVILDAGFLFISMESSFPCI